MAEVKAISIDYKEKGTKLIRIKAKVYGKKIKDIRINGDFFIYPEESMTKIEKAIVGAEIKKRSIVKRIEKIDAELIGITKEDIEKALLIAAGGENDRQN